MKPKTTGTWVIAVTTSDLFATGRFALHIDCFPDTSPSAGCVEQELQCGNYAYATATPQRFPVRVDNPCGTDDSNVFTLLSEPTRRRAVRH